MDEEKVIDVEMDELNDGETVRIENSKNRIIKGKPKFFTTGYVANVLNEADSTIRSWCDEFDEFLQLRKVGKHRRFTEFDIEKLKYIQTLIRQDALSHSQVKEYLSTPEAEMLIAYDEKQSQDKLIKAVSSILAEKLGAQIQDQMDNLKSEFKNVMIQSLQSEALKLSTSIQEQNSALKEELKDEVAATVEKHVNVLNDDITSLRAMLEERDQKMEQNLHDLKIRMEERARIAVEQKSNRGFFSKLFGKD